MVDEAIVRRWVMDIFAEFLADAERELELLRLAAQRAPLAVAPSGVPEPTNEARHLLCEQIAEQEALVERMRTYCGAPDVARRRQGR